MSADAPWWASGAEDLDPDADPLAAHRAARSARTPWEPPAAHDVPPPPGTARSLLEDAAGGLALLARLAAARRDRTSHDAGVPGRDATSDGSGPAAHPPRASAACRGCMWCTLLRAVDDARPEVVEHLGEAVRHLTAAARALLDATEDHDAWETIPLDDDDGGGW